MKQKSLNKKPKEIRHQDYSTNCLKIINVAAVTKSKAFSVSSQRIISFRSILSLLHTNPNPILNRLVVVILPQVGINDGKKGKKCVIVKVFSKKKYTDKASFSIELF
jgi:hypothetical protein